MGITIKEIAEKSGFGVGTVSRALREDPFLVKEETRKKILAVAKKYGYAKDVGAQALVTGKSTDIGLMIPAMFGSYFYNDFYIKIISGIMDALSESEYKLRVLFLREKSKFRDVMRESRSLKLGGLILSPYCQDFFIEEKDIKKLDVPVVVLGKEVVGKNIRSVVLDDFKGGYDGTSFLIDLGHENIAVIRGFREDIEKRYKGYRKAMKDNGLKLNEDLILKGDALEGSGFERTRELIKKKKKPTAVFCLDDEMAYGALRAMREGGLECPRDMSVMGFDGMDIDNFTFPHLTTMARPVSYMAETAVRFLLDRDMWKRSSCIKVEAKVEERDSCRKIK